MTPTYVIAIEEQLSADGITDAVDQWFHRSKDFLEIVPAIPRLLIAGCHIAFANDGLKSFTFPQFVIDEAAGLYGPTGRVLAIVWPNVLHRWACLATDLLLNVSKRLGISHDYIGSNFNIERYLPGNEAMEFERLSDPDIHHILWDGRFPFFRPNN